MLKCLLIYVQDLSVTVLVDLCSGFKCYSVC